MPCLPVSGMDTVTFIVTRRCGAACHGCPVEINRKDMSPEVLKMAAGGLFRVFPDIHSFKFFGGEPLLNFELVLRGITLIRASCPAPRIELGTNGLLLDSAKVSSLRRYPEVQVNINAGVSIRKIFFDLPNVMWNLCVTPEDPFSAVRRLSRIAAFFPQNTSRVNLLPEYYRVWSTDQLRGLRNAARELAAVIRSSSLVFEKGKRTGGVPLFNWGVSVDTDGNCYSTNFCLVRMPERLRRKFLMGNINFPEKLKKTTVPLRKKDLVEVFGFDAVASTYAADRIMAEYV